MKEIILAYGFKELSVTNTLVKRDSSASKYLIYMFPNWLKLLSYRYTRKYIKT